jgi:4-amino-4-deoxy-L-arabinose transferase-like glycosyltransferase
MQLKIERKAISKKDKLLFGGIAALLLPALLIHLGLVGLYGDEGIRALVALEMGISGNWLTPTLFGEFYYNKPPLYNWILLAVYQLTGRSDEFITRLPTVIFLLAFAATIYFFIKKNLRTLIPHTSYLIPALAFITCGRILFWDSLLALIDICFSWLMYGMFMVIFQQGENQRYGRLFAGAYLLAAAGFLLKGLPSVVFLGIALLTYFIWQKKWRKLVSWAHLGGMAVFALLVGGYYALYGRHNGLEVVFKTLFDESAKRTFVKYGIGDTVLHLFTFPFEILYHFLPWTLLAVYFFRKNAFLLIRQNKFITWNLLVFLTTIVPYWSSVEVYPRYLFMHVPLLFTAVFYLHFENKKDNATLTKWIERIFFAACVTAFAASLLPPFWDAVSDVPYLHLKTGVVASLLGILTWLYRRWKERRMLVFVLVLLTARIGFNWFILPSRLDVECSTEVRRTTLEAVKILDGRPLRAYENSLGQQPVTGYYFTRETGQILRAQFDNFDKNSLYIVNISHYGPWDFDIITNVTIQWKCSELQIARIKE